MPKVLLVEDDELKRSKIFIELEQYFKSREGDLIVIHAENLASATKFIFESSFDLIILDLMLPRRNGEPAVDISDEVVNHIADSEKNSSASVVAISKFEEIVDEKRKRFVDAGILIIHFDDKDDCNWKASLNVCLQRVECKIQIDFIVICALEKERNAFRNAACEIGELIEIRGLDCLRLNIGKMKGLCIKLPRMGLVDAAVVSARAIESFSPKYIAMSGICGGFSDQVQIGTIVVSDICWEHQAGKWTDTGFKFETFQLHIDASLRTSLSQYIEKEENLALIKADLLIDENVKSQQIFLLPSVTGSAVIASSEKLEEIKPQNRKIAAIDMEMYGVYRAAELSTPKPVFFGAKTVVDLADAAKGDQYHVYGSIISARFIVEFLRHLQKFPARI